MNSNNKPGRPVEFSQEIADKLLEQIATTSKSLKRICDDPDLPSVRTVFNWLAKGEEKNADPIFATFLHQYARAREHQADFLADEIIEIADDSSRDKLRVKRVKNADGGSMELVEEDKEFTNRSKLRVEARKWVASKLKPKKYGDKIDHTLEAQVRIEPITGMEVK